ncbi:hypothetical protein GE061_005403 [Apolygus lucorum]|uniref:C2H2-type domain-containing protein n=1 Tax=Apolygus lucorum TaxID=248454 RepID=A0A8S9WYS8_APOLU|nr:hypothetical protein GE061_005403 [Apolygus lucorum]
MPSRRCTICGYETDTKFKFERHSRTHLKCVHCRRTFESYSEASEHEGVCNKLPFKQCPLCPVQCTSIEKIKEHLTKLHGVVMNKELIEFNSPSDKKTSYLICHRSGKPRLSKTDDTRLRLLKKQGSNKINAFCPARMHVDFYNSGRVVVYFVSTHVGHDFSLGRLPLDKEYRAKLAAQIKKNVPLDSILEAERKAFQENSKETGEGNTCGAMSRANLLSRKDLHNIARDFQTRPLKTSSHRVPETTSSRHRVPETTSSRHRVPETTSSRHRVPETTSSRRGHSLADAKAAMIAAMEIAENEDQIDALYKQAAHVKVILQSLATKPSEEILSEPSVTSTSPNTPQKRFCSQQSLKRKMEGKKSPTTIHLVRALIRKNHGTMLNTLEMMHRRDRDVEEGANMQVFSKFLRLKKKISFRHLSH